MIKHPITRLILYKHGVGFYERRASFEGEEVVLTFQKTEMNDVLKSLTVIDRGQGQVYGLEYPTQQSREEKIRRVSINLNERRSLRDLLASLSGRRVRLLIGEAVRISNFPNQAQFIPGRLLGMDEGDPEQPLKSSCVSLLRDNSSQVLSVELEKIAGIDLLDERSIDDLRYLLDTNAGKEDECAVTAHLSPGEHDLSISYIAPAPAWRVSYRLMSESGEKKNQARALLLGLGIVDNQLDEDLENVSLTLVSGMPVSFVYDLFTPHTPRRPVVEEEDKTVAEVQEGALMGAQGAVAPAPAVFAARADGAGLELANVQDSIPVRVEGKDLGELFEYRINAPVRIGRGQSAIVPLLSANLSARKELIYKVGQADQHPYASIRMLNSSGMVLERGPLTVMEDGLYVGEAVMPFTPLNGEIAVPYAVELGVKVHERFDFRRETQGLGVKDGYFIQLDWDIQATRITAVNGTAKEAILVVEMPRRAGYDLFDSPTPKEIRADAYRFELKAPARGETTLQVQERMLQRRQEELRKQSLAVLRKYLENGLLVEALYRKLSEILQLWDLVSEKENERQGLQKETELLARNQERIRNNLQTLGAGGAEGELRDGYIQRLQETEKQIVAIEKRDRALSAEIEETRVKVEQRIRELEGGDQ